MSDIQAQFRIDWPGFTLDVDLTLPGQGVTAIFGPSGSGKTTLLRCIAGLERAAAGRLSVCGECWQEGRHWTPPHKRPIGYVFQEPRLFPHLTVLGNLRYGQRRAAGARVADLAPVIELLGIGPLLERRPERLSGGERQRVAIARALAVQPRLLLMDEPLAALDLARKQEILPYLERLHVALALPVLYVSHAPGEVARLADHLVVLEAGRVRASGPLGEVLARVDVPIRLAGEAGVVIAAVVGAIDTAWHLARLDFDGGHLWTRDPGVAVGQPVRVRVLARDVSLARESPTQSSIQNILAARIDAIAAEEEPGLALLRLRIGGAVFLAHLTRRAVHDLGLAVGDSVYAQIKSVALSD